MSKRPRIVVVGSLVFDFVARAPHLPRRGETVLGQAFGMFPGGKGANQAVQASRLGAEVFLIGCIGEDFLGDNLLSSLHESGVRTEFVRRDKAVKTAACCIHVDGEGNNAIVIVPEANGACSPDDVDAAREVVESADIVLCQLEIPLPTVAHALDLASRKCIRTILNPAPAQRLPEGLLTKVNFLTPNEVEAEVLTGLLPSVSAAAWESSVARNLLDSGPRAVIVTLGERGAYLATNDHRSMVPTFRVAVVDATAAGDAFSGALAVGLAEGSELGDAVRFANAAGALATTKPGAQPSLATRTEVDALLVGNK